MSMMTVQTVQGKTVGEAKQNESGRSDAGSGHSQQDLQAITSSASFEEQAKHAQLDLHAAITPAVERMLQVQSQLCIT